MTSVLPPITINLIKPPTARIHRPYGLPVAIATSAQLSSPSNIYDSALKPFQDASHDLLNARSSSPARCDSENSAPQPLRNSKGAKQGHWSAHPDSIENVDDVGRSRATHRILYSTNEDLPSKSNCNLKSPASQIRSNADTWTRPALEPKKTAPLEVSIDLRQHGTISPVQIEGGVKSDANTSLESFPTLHTEDPMTPQAKTRAIFTTTSLQPTQVSPTEAHTKHHRPRLSNASSAFVHSIKTASISNGSLSILPRTSHLARSSDSASRSILANDSTRNQRPISLSSSDEAAFARGVKRRQILDELILTEESYVADLRALVYLYSTLLATASTIANSMRCSIQRNVMSLLRLHEDLVEKLHRAAYRAAARKWIDTASPGNLAGGLHKRHHNGRASCIDPDGLKSESTGDSATDKELTVQPLKLVVADSADILDLAAILEEHLASFLLYEEYSANHEVITHELQNQTPVLWSTYEAGIESLAGILSTMDQKSTCTRKGMTVGDLLIKPIQRICKYPLLLDDLLRHLPLVDGSGAHEVLDGILQRLRETVWAVNIATDNHFARVQIQRRALVQNLLNLRTAGIQQEKFRDLGHVQLCGVLYVAYQTPNVVNGCYALCVLFDHHFLIAVPSYQEGIFELIALVNLADLHIGSVDDGKGMQCRSTLYTFKIYFAAQGMVYEILLSACSSKEENEWLSGLEGYLRPHLQEEALAPSFDTKCQLDLKPISKTYAHSAPLSHKISIQRAVTSANRSATCQIILRNTHNPQDLQDLRSISAPQVNRSHSHASINKVIVLAPKRSERTKLEALLSDVWTKDRLPFPGMITSKSSQILRASAGSLVRKLSLASIQAPFSRRSASITVSSKPSYDAIAEGKQEITTFRVRRKSFGDRTPIRHTRPKDIPELDTMDNVIGRMIGGGSFGSKRLSFSGGEKSLLKKSQVRRRASSFQVGPEDPAAIFYDHDEKHEEVAQKLDPTARHNGSMGREAKRTRWSKPIAKLKELKVDGFRTILHSSK